MLHERSEWTCRREGFDWSYAKRLISAASTSDMERYAEVSVQRRTRVKVELTKTNMRVLSVRMLVLGKRRKRGARPG